jgi:hypothetical protein
MCRQKLHGTSPPCCARYLRGYCGRRVLWRCCDIRRHVGSVEARMVFTRLLHSPFSHPFTFRMDMLGSMKSGGASFLCVLANCAAKLNLELVAPSYQVLGRALKQRLVTSHIVIRLLFFKLNFAMALASPHTL